MTRQISWLALVAAIIVMPTGTAVAQGGFGGSFEPDAPAPVLSPAQTPPPASAAAPGAGDFGGSFGDTGGAAPPPPPPPSPPPPGGSGGGTPPPPPPPVGGGGTAPPPPAPPPPPTPPQPPEVGPTPGAAGAPQPPQPPNPPAQTDIEVPPQVTQLELQDFGVPPTSTLRQDQFHAPTPTMIPGAQVVTTKALADAINSGTRIVLIDVLGGNYGLPGAVMAPALAQGGTLQDRLQQQASQWLQQVTGGDSSVAIVIYCSDPMCWLSYNAALRTVAAGYGNVYWYRGGLHAWQMAGLSLTPSSF